MIDSRYPIGHAPQMNTLSPRERLACLKSLEVLPVQVRDAVNGLSDAALDTPYRADGWTIRQVVHHLADAHLNAYIRFKLVLTEAEPTIKPWREEGWATLPDAGMEIAPSLTLLDSIHIRLVALLTALDPEDWERPFIHPDLISGTDRQAYQTSQPSADDSGRLNLDQLLAVVAWHGQHHTAHILQGTRRLLEKTHD